MSRIAGVWRRDEGWLDGSPGQGCTVILDGRLDNREELLRELCDGGLSAGSPDSSYIRQAFLRWGGECFSRLNGEFAVAILDREQHRLMLARDPVGCRPLYYWTDRNTFVFGSEIKTILSHPGVPSRANKNLLADYFVRDRLPYEDCGETFFQDVQAVLPGHRITVATTGLTSTSFWDFDPEAIVRFRSYSDYAERLRELLWQAVKRRLRTTHPVGVAVSGGLDSSIVLCVADHLRRAGACNEQLLPVSLSARARQPAALKDCASPRRTSIDEMDEEARSLALLESETGFRIERLPFGAPGEAEDLDDAAWHSEWPRFDDGWCAQRVMFTWAHAQGSTTLLTGHWSDQLSFGTAYLCDLARRFDWREIAAHIAEYPRWFVDADPRYFGRRFWHELAFDLTPHRLRRIARRFLRARRNGDCDARIARDIAARIDRPRSAFPRLRCGSAHARAIYQTVRAQAHRLQFEAEAKLAASCGVDRTTPFLDRDLIAYLMAVPGEIQNRGGVPRALLREAMRGIVPDVILRRHWRNEDHVSRSRELAYLSTSRSLDAAYGLGLLAEAYPLNRETLAFAGLESWSRVFFSDRLSSIQHRRDGVCDPMDTDPLSKDDRDKLPYSPPKLTVHGDLRTITAAKQSDRSEAGQPKTFNSGMP